MVRRRPDSSAGFQVLIDHRKSGSIGGFFGDGTGGFHAVPYILDATATATAARSDFRSKPRHHHGTNDIDKPALLDSSR